MTSVYHPRPYRQLGRGVPVPGKSRGSMDCGPATVRMGIRQLTRGELDPSIEDIRARMGKPGPVPTSTADALRAVNSYNAPEMGPLDRRPLNYQRLTGAMFEPLLRDAVKGGAFVQVAIDYGTFNRLMGRTGDPNFRGGHSVGIHGWDRRGGRTVWQLFDPLDDGRRTGIPSGPRWVRPGPIIAAWKDMGHFFGIFRGGERTL